MGLDEDVLKVLRDVGSMGATASQIAGRLKRKREVVSHYLWILKKAGKVSNRGRNVWVLIEKFEDPFNVPLEEFRRLPLDEYAPLAEKAYRMCREKVEKLFEKEDVHHVVVCDGNIVYASSEVDGIPGEVVNNLMMERGKPCYVFSRKDMVEEASWIEVNEDYYPTLELFLGGKEWIEEKVSLEGRKVAADFDTGNPYYTIFDEKLGEGIVPPPQVYETHRGVHLGKTYLYFLREVKIGVKGAGERFKCRLLRVRFVRLWKRSPLLLANPKRKGFTGRRLMFAYNFKITLNPQSRTSEIEFLD